MARNLRNAMLYDLSFVVVVVVVVFSSHFLKENLFWGGSCVGRVGQFCPKVVFGCQEHVQKVSWASDRRFGFVPRQHFDESCRPYWWNGATASIQLLYGHISTIWHVRPPKPNIFCKLMTSKWKYSGHYVSELQRRTQRQRQRPRQRQSVKLKDYTCGIFWKSWGCKDIK